MPRSGTECRAERAGTSAQLLLMGGGAVLAGVRSEWELVKSVPMALSTFEADEGSDEVVLERE